MKDIREEIFKKYGKEVDDQYTLDVIYEEDFKTAMDEYAERILQYMHDNELSISMSRDWDIKKFLGEIKTKMNEKNK